MRRFLLLLLAALPVLAALAPAAVVGVQSAVEPVADGWRFSGQAWREVYIASPVAGASPTAHQLGLLGNTLALGGLAVAVAMALGLPVGLALARGRVAGQSVAEAALLVPVLVPVWVGAWAWLKLTGPEGPAAALDGLLGPGSVAGAAWVLALGLWPIVALATAAGARRVDTETEEAARLFGGRWLAWRHVAWSTIWPAVASGGLLVLLLALHDFGVPALYRVDTLALEVYARFEAHVDWRRMAGPAAQAAPLVAIGLIAVTLLLRVEAHGRHGARVARLGLAAGKSHWRPTLLVWGVLAISPGVTLLQLAIDAIAPGDLFGRLDTLLGDGQTADSIARTVETAVLAALTATLVWGPSAWLLVRVGGRAAHLLLALAIVPLALPPSLTGIGWLSLTTGRAVCWQLADLLHVCTALATGLAVAFVVHRATHRHPAAVLSALTASAMLLAIPGWPQGVPPPGPDGLVPLPPPGTLAAAIRHMLNGPFALLAVHALIFSPFVVRFAAGSIAAIPPGWHEAARTLGHGLPGQFRRIDLPFAGSALAAAAMLVYASSAGHVAATVLVAPPGDVLLAPRVYNLAHYGRDDEVALLCLLFVALAILPWLVLVALTNRRPVSI